jgi:hypothetical protein
MGFYLTRHAWEDEQRRDAAVHLLAYLSSGENAVTLGGFQFSGRLLASAAELTGNPLYTPVQDQMSQEARNEWFRLIPGIATGSITAEELWARVTAMTPFPAR